MEQFVERTGVGGSPDAARRYLWTDAFAVCNLLGMRAVAPHGQQLALALVDQVHRVLGRHRADDRRHGWISGLDEEQGLLHPTRGGLRIGKQLPERAVAEPFDERQEWHRDGQYFQYLTRWMHALVCVADATGDRRHLDHAVELARAAHAAFVYTASGGALSMCWKMGIALDRPLVMSRGHHDALDGLLAYTELRDQLGARASSEDRIFLGRAIVDMRAIGASVDLTTADPLGLGGLLIGALQLLHSIVLGESDDRALLIRILSSARSGLQGLRRSSPFELPPQHRIGFRELGLSIGLRAVPVMATLWQHTDRHSDGGMIGQHLDALLYQLPMADLIEQSWLDPRYQAADSWTSHLDINEVMLATSLAPDGYFATELAPH